MPGISLYYDITEQQLIRPFKEMGLTTFYHSCGSIVPVIDDLIEMGVDILDPIQPDTPVENIVALYETACQY